MAFGRCRKCRGGTPTGERARSGGCASRPIRGASRTRWCGSWTMRLSAFRFLLSFVVASEAKPSRPKPKRLECFVAPRLAMTVRKGFLTVRLDQLGRESVARTERACNLRRGGPCGRPPDIVGAHEGRPYGAVPDAPSVAQNNKKTSIMPSSPDTSPDQQKFLKRRSFEEGQAVVDAAHIATHRLYCDALRSGAAARSGRASGIGDAWASRPAVSCAA